MGRLIYSALTSLDGYIEDEHGRIEWGRPSEEVASAVNELQSTVGTYLYGRKMYEVMSYWEDSPTDGASPAELAFTHLWRNAEKIVFSRTLTDVSIRRAELRRELDPEWLKHLVTTSERDVSLGGAQLAGDVLRAGLVDEIHLFVEPVTIGGGLRWSPAGWNDGLDLLASRSFPDGTVLLRYATRRR